MRYSQNYQVINIFISILSIHQACLNLLERNITNLVCIGGDGSLTGANQFRKDWPDLIKNLVKDGKITQEKADANPNIQIVGMVRTLIQPLNQNIYRSRTDISKKNQEFNCIYINLSNLTYDSVHLDFKFV